MPKILNSEFLAISVDETTDSSNTQEQPLNYMNEIADS